MVSVEIYDVDGAVIVFLGTHGNEGVFQRHQDDSWEYHPPGAVTWDSFHQQVYRNFKGEALTMADLKVRGITLPDLEKSIAQAPGMRWKDNFKAQARLADVPKALLPDLMQHIGETMDAYLVLLEDAYETSLGDGKYLYPEAAYWTRMEAEEDIERRQNDETDAAKRQWYRYSVKMVLLAVEEANQRVISELDVGPYEHYSLDDVLRLLSRRHGKPAT